MDITVEDAVRRVIEVELDGIPISLTYYMGTGGSYLQICNHKENSNQYLNINPEYIVALITMLQQVLTFEQPVIKNPLNSHKV